MEDPWESAYEFAVEVARLAGEVGAAGAEGARLVHAYI